MSVDANPLRLTEWTSCGGCAAKWGASLLADLVSEFPATDDASLVVGLAPFDDAAVYRVGEGLALVSTTDFFPPLVDDPSDFGAIAAANACSDIFAMGARVAIAVNVAAFPEHFPREAIAQIFAAGAAVVAEAGGTVAGGHTIRNPSRSTGWPFRASSTRISPSVSRERERATSLCSPNRSARGSHSRRAPTPIAPRRSLACARSTVRRPSG